MADFRFVHAADLHLDAPFKGISHTAPQVAEALREASLRALDNLVELCVERDAAFLVLAGDLYDGPVHGLRAQLRLRDGLARLSDAGIPTFVAHGNHDPLETGWSAVSERWPERAMVFPAGTVGVGVVERGGEPIALVHGISYARRDVRDNLARCFERRPSLVFQVGVLHCAVAGASDDHAAYSPCSLDDLYGAGLDYWALGHIHRRKVLAGEPHGSGPWIVYPGTLQGRSPRPGEVGAKGATVVEVRGGHVAAAEHVACDEIRFERVEIDLGRTPSCDSVTGVRDALSEAALETTERAGGRSVVLRARLRGRSPLASEMKRRGALDELLASLREEAPAGDPFCWWDEIEDASRPDVDLAALRRGGDFVADLVNLADELSGAAPGAFAGRVSLAEPALTERAAPHYSAPAGATGRREGSTDPLEAMRSALVEGLPTSLRQRAERLLDGEPSLWPDLLSDGVALALDRLGVGSEAGGP